MRHSRPPSPVCASAPIMWACMLTRPSMPYMLTRVYGKPSRLPRSPHHPRSPCRSRLPCLPRLCHAVRAPLRGMWGRGEPVRLRHADTRRAARRSWLAGPRRDHRGPQAGARTRWTWEWLRRAGTREMGHAGAWGGSARVGWAPPLPRPRKHGPGRTPRRPRPRAPRPRAPRGPPRRLGPRARRWVIRASTWAAASLRKPRVTASRGRLSGPTIGRWSTIGPTPIRRPVRRCRTTALM